MATAKEKRTLQRCGEVRTVIRRFDKNKDFPPQLVMPSKFSSFRLLPAGSERNHLVIINPVSFANTWRNAKTS